MQTRSEGCWRAELAGAASRGEEAQLQHHACRAIHDHTCKLQEVYFEHADISTASGMVSTQRWCGQQKHTDSIWSISRVPDGLACLARLLLQSTSGDICSTCTSIMYPYTHKVMLAADFCSVSCSSVPMHA